jgi:multidrug efflux system outer membrane protein
LTGGESGDSCKHEIFLRCCFEIARLKHRKYLKLQIKQQARDRAPLICEAVQNISAAMAHRGSPLKCVHPRERGVVNLRPAGSVGGILRGRFGASAGRGIALACLLGGAAMLTGCITAGDLPDPALDVPPAYKEGAPGDLPPQLDWWRGFKSAELTSLIEEAQRVNLDIAAAAARLVQADASARIAGAPLLPSLTGTGSEQISRASGQTSTGTSATNLRRQIRTYTASLTASYELDFWGKNRDAALAADDTATANRFDRDVVVLATNASVANTYFTVLATQDRIRIANNNIVSAQRIYDAIKQRVNVGTSTDLELSQQESTLDNLKALVPTLRQTLAQSIYALAVLISRPPESVRIRGGGLGQVALPRVTPGLPSQILTQRPDVRRQEAQLASATANVGNARAQFFPSIQLTAQGGYQSATLAALFSPQATFYNAAASLTQPIFDGLKIEGNFELQKAKQDELLQTYRKTVIQAFSDVDTALATIRETGIRVRLLVQTVAAARRAFELSEQRLNAGTIDTTTVLNTEQTLFQAEDSLAQARLTRVQAIISLYQALGGGWTQTTEGPADAI